MRYKITVLTSAKNELRRVYSYIANNLSNPTSAVKIYRQAIKEIHSLETMPLRYPLYDAEPWHSRGVRYFSVSSYLIFYSVNEETRTVTVHRVIYGGRDIASDLEKED